MAADVHQIPETNDATALGKTAATALVPEIVMTEGEKGAGLEIAATETGEIETEMDAEFETASGVVAENVGTIDEVNTNPQRSGP
jgi:hypothetical protein